MNAHTSCAQIVCKIPDLQILLLLVVLHFQEMVHRLFRFLRVGRTFDQLQNVRHGNFMAIVQYVGLIGTRQARVFGPGEELGSETAISSFRMRTDHLARGINAFPAISTGLLASDAILEEIVQVRRAFRGVRATRVRRALGTDLLDVINDVVGDEVALLVLLLVAILSFDALVDNVGRLAHADHQVQMLAQIRALLLGAARGHCRDKLAEGQSHGKRLGEASHG